MGLVLALVVLLFSPTEATAATGTTTRVSVASDGSPGNDESYGGDLSGDGRFVAFYSKASNLVSGDTNGAYDVFVHDRHTGATSRVSVHSDGTEGDGDSEVPSLSGDGRYVVFESSASNLVTGDTNGEEDVFVHDRGTGATARVSMASGGAQGTGNSFASSISADGRYVAFSTVAANLMTNVFNLQLDPNRVSGRGIVVHDRQTGLTIAVGAGHRRVSGDGTQANGGSSGPSISADGRYLAFSSTATNLVAGDTSPYVNAFLHDRQLGATRQVGVASDGTEGDSWTYAGALSDDGNHVSFASWASNLVPGDTSYPSDVFVHGAGSDPVVSVGDGSLNEGKLAPLRRP